MKSIFYIIGIIVLIVIGGLFMIKANGTNANIIQDSGSEDVQNIVLSFKDYNYYPNTIKVKANQPVRISLDSSVSGCLRSFTIRDLGIAKNLQTPADYIEFTPTKKGTYGFACSMGMGTGTLVVE
jgi:plastocyanin domain-containing protein